MGGEIRGHEPQIYLIYPQGNHISAIDETPYLQIGENKYGKAVLDRVITRSLSLEDCARLALVSLDATRGSNITVGLPFEVATYRSGTFAIERHLKLDIDSPDYQAIRERWHEGVRRVFLDLPKFEWERGDQADSTGFNENLDASVSRN